MCRDWLQAVWRKEQFIIETEQQKFLSELVNSQNLSPRNSASVLLIAAQLTITESGVASVSLRGSINNRWVTLYVAVMESEVDYFWYGHSPDITKYICM